MRHAIGEGAARQGRSSHDPDRSLVGFRLDGVSYAVPIQVVREVVVPTSLAQLPQLPAEVAGVADHRGDVIPVIDLRRRFGLPEAATGTQLKWILIRTGAGDFGLIVDSVTGVFGSGGDAVRPAPNIEGEMQGMISCVIKHESGMVFVLDTSAFDGVVSRVATPGLNADESGS